MSDPVTPERFRGDLAGWLAWAETGWEPGHGWCARHWAPTPVEGLNGLTASVYLFQDGLALAPREARRAKGRRAKQLVNLWLASLTQPLCCELGDERVAAVWQRVREETST